MANIFVHDTGNILTNGANLQTAINAAVSGDVILLDPGVVYKRATFDLVPYAYVAGTYITIKTDTTNLPAVGTRVTSSYFSTMAKLQSSVYPTIQGKFGIMNATNTAIATQPARWWKLIGIEIGPQDGNWSHMIAIGYGDGDAATHRDQYDLRQVPEFFYFQHCYAHGDPYRGQKVGFALHCGAVTIKDCWTADFKHSGQDSQAIVGFNGPGPFTITNSHIEGAGENLMFGGSDPKIPNLVPSNLLCNQNHFYKPLSWMNPIVDTPSAFAAVATGVGTLAAGSYFYRLGAWRIVSENNKVYSLPTTASAAVGANGRVVLSWSAPPVPDGYRLYRGTVSGVFTEYIELAAGDVGYIDSGGGLWIADVTNPFKGQVWQVKNLLEFKLMDGALVQGNLFENCWAQGQTGEAFAMTPRNQGGTANWSVVQNVMIRDNWIRHCSRGLIFLGNDDQGDGTKISLQLNHISIINNLWTDIVGGYKAYNAAASNGMWMALNIGTRHVPPRDIVMDHNTVICDGMAIGVSLKADEATPFPNITWTNNLMLHNTYGIREVNTGLYGSGDPTINAAFPVSSGRDFRKNTLAGGPTNIYQSILADTFFPTVADWQAQFVNFAGGDYNLAASPTPNLGYNTASTTGGKLGADIAAINAAMGGVVTPPAAQLSASPGIRFTTSATLFIPAAGALLRANAGIRFSTNCDLTTAVRLTRPSAYFKNQLVDHIFRSRTWIKPTQNYIGLLTSAPLLDGSGGVEVATGAYARVSVPLLDANWAAPVGGNGTTSNLVPIRFPLPTADWGMITHAGLYDAPTGGNLIIWQQLDAPILLLAGQNAVVFRVGQLQFQIT